MKICISLYVMVVIVADDIPMLAETQSLHVCLSCDKDLHERVRVYMCVHLLVSVYVVCSL